MSITTPPQWKQGDWCFHEFNLCEVTKCQNGVITELSDGFFCMSGTNLNYGTFPLSKSTKVVSEAFAKLHDRLHALKAGALNHPDFKRYLVQKWVDCFDADRTVEQCHELQREAAAFVARIEEHVHGLNNVVVDGVRIFH